MNKGKCKNCGGDEAIHRWDTLQCPFGGREAPFPRKTEYINSYYVEDDSEILDELTTLRTQQAELVKALEAFTEINVDGLNDKVVIYTETSGKKLEGVFTVGSVRNARNALAKVKGDA